MRARDRTGIYGPVENNTGFNEVKSQNDTELLSRIRMGRNAHCRL